MKYKTRQQIQEEERTRKEVEKTNLKKLKLQNEERTRKYEEEKRKEIEKISKHLSNEIFNQEFKDYLNGYFQYAKEVNEEIPISKTIEVVNKYRNGNLKNLVKFLKLKDTSYHSYRSGDGQSGEDILCAGMEGNDLKFYSVEQGYKSGILTSGPFFYPEKLSSLKEVAERVNSYRKNTKDLDKGKKSLVEKIEEFYRKHA